MIIKNIFKTLVAVSFIFLLACEGPPPIDIYIATPEPKLVVASQIIPNQTMVVTLSKSFSALSNETKNDSVSTDFLEDIFVKNAIVTISYLNQTDTLQMLLPGVYASINTLLFDYGIYTLKAKDPATGMEVSSNSEILPFVPFDTVYPVINKTAGDSGISIKYSFTDIPQDDNYYVVNYYKKVNDTTGNFNLNTYLSIGSKQVLSDFELLSDKTFNNNQYSKETKLYGVYPSDTIAVTISNISQGYYEFLTAHKKSGAIFNQLTGEPINYPTNVTGGYGYFTTNYPDIRVFDLNNY